MATAIKKGSALQFYKELTSPNNITYKQPIGLYIGGEFVASKSGKVFDVISPSTEERITQVYEAGDADVDSAVIAAEKGFAKWSEMTPYERGCALIKVAEKIEENSELFATVETWDNGKALSMARDDVKLVAQTFRYYAGWCDKISGKVVEIDNDTFNYIRREPIGVCGAIIPWNFPLAMLSWKIAPALAAGNSMILKSAESTPLTALLFADMLREVPEIPKGTINILSGYGAAGGAIVAHPGIKKIAFTGSTATGRKILKGAADSNLKKVTLELGGKSPNIVFNDAKLDEAVESVLFGIFYNQGEVCCAGTRLFVQEGIYDTFLEMLKKRALELKVGDPFDPTVSYGAQTNKLQFDKVLEYIAQGKKEGKVLTGGSRIGEKGFYIEPTIFTDVDRNAVVATEEIFGPVLSVIKFKDADEALKFANESDYGLAAGVHTTNIEKALYVAQHVKSGTVWINTYHAMHPQLPFGGYKLSGNGRELGEEVLNNYLETKAVRIAGISTGLGAPKLN
ncbi:aldehyde dehydrogenase (NAD(P)(+)) [Starmerella bacillaris]|uniref:Aldehyde dehydrogenase 5, mitochondrial n=1 Tax=Starmerella bacillaris TaxID=1247836 RepID=A0AAV5RN44_STABA|nr:aldehyde dehydrogenase (NAD(P)(+)) [Starmerella bacillaris]